mmetsp:Transcript_14051/g.33520  ORF Transcript_14051/g.33520 Transcript_14051/m.33520 type:complete len:342 (-) Transcript_14051:137-1162(-)
MSESIFQGTILCKFHAKGKCQKGESCKFAHGKTALKFKPDLSKTKMCTTFRVNGDCKYGEDCTYAHDRSEIRRNIMRKKKMEELGLRPPAPTAPRSVSAPDEMLTSVNDVDLPPVRSRSANHAKIVDDFDLSLPIPARSESSNSQASTVCPPNMTSTCSVEDIETPFSRTVTWASSYDAADSDLPCLGVLVGRSATWADISMEAEDYPAPVGRSATWAHGSTRTGPEDTEPPCLGVHVGRRARWADISREAEDHPEPAGRSATWGHGSAVFEDMETPLPVDPIAFATTCLKAEDSESDDDEILDVFVKNTFLHFQPAAMPLGPLRHTKSLPLLLEKAGDEP